MNFINTLTHKINLIDENGVVLNRGKSIYEIFDFHNYLKELKLDKCENFIKNIDSYNKSHARPQFMVRSELDKDDLDKIKRFYSRKIFQDLRIGLSKLCVMCGGLSPAQLDHILDKKYYPEFYSYHKNLAPVCSCNQSKEPVTNIRNILHPYIDTILKKSIVKFKFNIYEDRTVESIDVIPTKDYEKVSAVTMHISSVFRGVTRRRAVDVALQIYDEVEYEYKNNTIMGRYLKEEFDKYKKRYNTPNNWYSMSYLGLMDIYPSDRLE